MGYRLYMAKMPKKEYEEMLNMTFDKFWDLYGAKDDTEEDGTKYLEGIYNFTQELHGFGKYVNYSEGMERVVFEDDKINERYDERNFHKLDKEIIKKIIEEYSNNVAKYYKSLIEGEQERSIFGLSLGKAKITQKAKNKRIYKHLIDRYNDFAGINYFKKCGKKYKSANGQKPYQIEGENLSASREYEYQIFDLIRIYREFDEEKEVLLYYGY